MVYVIILLASASHVHPDYTFIETEIKAHRSLQGEGKADRWYATHPKLGCGKDRDTPEEAALHLLMDHACTSIAIRRAPLTAEVCQDGVDFYITMPDGDEKTVTAPFKLKNDYDMEGAERARDWFIKWADRQDMAYLWA